MKTSYIFCSTFVAAAGVAALAPHAHAQSAIFTNFSETLVISTDTFESLTGVPLFIDDAVGFSDYLSPDIATDIETDPTMPTEIQTAAAFVPQVSEYQFLAFQGSNYIIFNGSASLAPIPDVTNPVTYLEAEGEQTGYSLVNQSSATIGFYSYTASTLIPPGNAQIIDGTATFDVYDVNGVFRANSTVPEPSAFALLGIGLFPLILRARRKAAL